MVRGPWRTVTHSGVPTLLDRRRPRAESPTSSLRSSAYRAAPRRCPGPGEDRSPAQGRPRLRSSDRTSSDLPPPNPPIRPRRAGARHAPIPQVHSMSSNSDSTHASRANHRWQAPEHRDRPPRQAGQRRRGRPDRRHDDPGRHRGRPRPRGPRLLPADGRLPREGLRRGQVPRRLHQARGAADHQGDPDLAAHRPADPAAVPRVAIATRSRSRPDRSRPTAQNDADVLVDDRRLGLAGAGPGAVPRPDRRHPAGAGRRPARRLPDGRGAGEQRPRPGRRQHRRRPSS